MNIHAHTHTEGKNWNKKEDEKIKREVPLPNKTRVNEKKSVFNRKSGGRYKIMKENKIF